MIRQVLYWLDKPIISLIELALNRLKIEFSKNWKYLTCFFVFFYRFELKYETSFGNFYLVMTYDFFYRFELKYETSFEFFLVIMTYDFF